MIKLNHSSSKPKWVDSRMMCPVAMCANKFHVVFLHLSDISQVGMATWMPNDGYNDGRWEDITCTNGNPVSGAEVIYWQQNPRGLLETTWCEFSEKYKP